MLGPSTDGSNLCCSLAFIAMFTVTDLLAKYNSATGFADTLDDMATFTFNCALEAEEYERDYVIPGLTREESDWYLDLSPDELGKLIENAS